jgi:hypothetical protein
METETVFVLLEALALKLLLPLVMNAQGRSLVRQMQDTLLYDEAPISTFDQRRED